MYYTLTEYGRKAIALDVSLRSVNESSGGLLCSPLLSTRYPSIRYPIPSQEAGSTLVLLLGSRVSMGGGIVYVTAEQCSEFNVCYVNRRNPRARESARARAMSLAAERRRAYRLSKQTREKY
ncbi:hypothetical protein EVAR_10526_1 [Eumeta japonica]|uniref:Uncharacterized protein n=1 Tax=Eumeta variegata TaxID=151549 RepID=A0A4C1THG8_EUMVA|nr:hypothetical protein EVAR_10526_1 [Eumeta japonica]